MISKLKNAWKDRNNIAMGFLMIITVYAAFVMSNINRREKRNEDEIV